jgi:para-aminobenzoate synthetase component I
MQRDRSLTNQLPADPAAVAAALRDDPGFVWLDASDSSARWGGDLVASQPEEIRRGEAGNWPGAAPAGALWAGWIDYEGGWTFGLFRQWLRFERETGTWSGAADLAGRALERLAASAAEPPRQAAGDPGQAVVLIREMAPEQYLAAVARAREWIAAGDIYQVNLSHRLRLELPAGAGLWPVYLRLRQVSPAPHAAYLNLGGREIASASPETFLDCAPGRVLTRPIKGTRPRGARPAADLALRRELAASPKERAELVMITDLERNDLGRIAKVGSVRVAALCEVESFAQVHHLVSVVTAEPRAGAGVFEILDACFPGGSITGAPKRRAMEIIRALEPVPRGLFTGAIGWTDGGRRGVFSIAIRTAWREIHGPVSLQVGAGIVADSDPRSEYVETLHKARGLAAAFAAGCPVAEFVCGGAEAGDLGGACP